MEERVFTGQSSLLLDTIKDRISKADRIDIIVSFLMFSGIKLILPSLKSAAERKVPIRILTGTYLGITEPFALRVLTDELGDNVAIHLYKDPSTSFHPKAWFFTIDNKTELYIGSSNISKSALSEGVEWNYGFDDIMDSAAVAAFHRQFEDLFANGSVPLTEDFLKDYQKKWVRPHFPSGGKTPSSGDTVEPNEAQSEALYSLERTRREGADKALVYAATGIGKTFLAAFDSRAFAKVLFIAHRDEILTQTARSFATVRPDSSIGFFNSDAKDRDADIILASVATIGSDRYLNKEWFSPDYFDYIVIDEFHHAVASRYQKVLDYFRPKFLLGLTATAERMDRQSIYSLCDYNVPYRLSLSSAVDRGYLVPFHYYGVYDETVDYSLVAQSGGHYKVDDLTRHLQTTGRTELVIKNYEKRYSRRALGFTSSREHAIYMARSFSEHGIPARAVVSGQTGDGYQMERSQALSLLSSGELRVIFSVDIFNEGLDVPDIDLVMFLRPTESPVIFLQQLGRGLRKAPGKDYLDVLDFIGNYNNAFMVPSLLARDEGGWSEVASDKAAMYNPAPQSLPSGCIVDLDFRLIDLFRIMMEKETPIRERIHQTYLRAKESNGAVPTRCQLFDECTGAELNIIFSNAKLNPFKDYLAYRIQMGDSKKDEYSMSAAADFIHKIETTAMSKSYKVPVLLAFIDGERILKSVEVDRVVTFFKDFYSKGRNYLDMERDEGRRNFSSWSLSKVKTLVLNNPVKFLQQSAPEFFHLDGNTFSISDSLDSWLDDPFFVQEFKDAVQLRKIEYWFKRYDEQH